MSHAQQDLHGERGFARVCMAGAWGDGGGDRGGLQHTFSHF